MKKVIAVICILAVFIFAGCGARYSALYEGSEGVIETIEEAIAVCDYCIAGKIDAKSAVEQLEVLQERCNRLDATYASTAGVNIGLAAREINHAILEVKLGTGTIVSVDKAVEAARDGLIEHLYE